MTPDDFRRVALSLPQVEEKAHFGQPDFRVGGKIIATLGAADRGLGMVALTPELQEMLVAAEPGVFAAVPGGWGRKGSTHVTLAAADEATLRSALAKAWRLKAGKTLAKLHPEVGG